MWLEVIFNTFKMPFSVTKSSLWVNVKVKQIASQVKQITNFGQIKIVCYCHFANFGQIMIAVFTNFGQVTHLFIWENKSTSFLKGKAKNLKPLSETATGGVL